MSKTKATEREFEVRIRVRLGSEEGVEPNSDDAADLVREAITAVYEDGWESTEVGRGSLYIRAARVGYSAMILGSEEILGRRRGVDEGRI